MQFAAIVAQSLQLPTTAGEWLIWIVIAAVIVGLWLVIRRTRQRAYRDYFDRQRAAEQQRLNDPDMARPDTGDDTPGSE
jgi:cytochrome c-type biogenesis protein CcmH/NrfF